MKIGYCVNQDFQNGNPCPKAVTKENQLAASPFITKCSVCEADLKIEFIKQEKSGGKTKMPLIIAVAAGLLIIGLAIFFLRSGEEKPQLATDPVPAEQPTEIAKVEEVEEQKAASVEEKAAPEVQPTPAPSGTQTKNFSNGDRYVGEIKNG
ncbi:MAG: hypothetical protein ACOCUH_04505, partial [Bacteriovoracia bacterium]